MRIFSFLQLFSVFLSAPVANKRPTRKPTTYPTTYPYPVALCFLSVGYIGFGGPLEVLCKSAPSDNIFIGVRGFLGQYTTASGLTTNGKKILKTSTQYTTLANIFGDSTLKVSLENNSNVYVFMTTDLGNGMSYAAYQTYSHPLMFLDESTANIFASITGQDIGVYDKNTNIISGSGILLNVIRQDIDNNH